MVEYDFRVYLGNKVKYYIERLQMTELNSKVTYLFEDKETSIYL